MLSYETLYGNIIEVRLDGEADGDQMSALREELWRVAAKNGGRVRVLFVPREAGEYLVARTGSVGMDFDLFREVEKLAVLTDSGWYRNIVSALTATLPFHTRTFGPGERNEALAWLRN